MDKAVDGGAAFPTFNREVTPNGDYESRTTLQPGMSLRDYFAAQALAGLLGDSRTVNHAIDIARDAEQQSPEVIAPWAYAYADAMLKAR